jgi:hypothetical protein
MGCKGNVSIQKKILFFLYSNQKERRALLYGVEGGFGDAGWCLFSNECIFKVNFRLEKRSSLSHLTVKENLARRKEVLEDLVGACAIMNKNS